MFSRQIARTATGVSTRAPSLTVRSFTTSLAAAQSNPQTPSLGDIQPGQEETFNSKQKEFRAQLVEAQKQREASALQSIKSAQASSKDGDQLNSAGNAAAAAQKSKQEPQRKQGPLTNLIYGTKEGRELDAQLEASFSQVLARGKYVHSIVFHDVKPECVDEYVELVGSWYPRMAAMPENKVHLVGSWRTEVGDCDTFGKTSHGFRP